MDDKRSFEHSKWICPLVYLKRYQKFNAFEYGNAEKRSIVFQPDAMSHSLQADKTINK